MTMTFDASRDYRADRGARAAIRCVGGGVAKSLGFGASAGITTRLCQVTHSYSLIDNMKRATMTPTTVPIAPSAKSINAGVRPGMTFCAISRTRAYRDIGDAMTAGFQLQ